MQCTERNFFLPEKALQKSMYFVYSFLNYAAQYMYFSS